MVDPSKELRAIPSTEALLQRCEAAFADVSRALVLDAVRAETAHFREDARAGRARDPAWFDGPEFIAALSARIDQALRRRHERVINATGILLHTGLGRAPLCDWAWAALNDVARYAIVEVDPDSGRRDEREVRVARLLCELTGAQAATVVNNNAGATLLALCALAAGREVIVSRGELVEIGGGFRMPDVMAASGAVMREVGTTNRTHLSDYNDALSPATAMVLKVHPSNFRMLGFTAAPSLADLVTLAHANNVLVGYDLGSGLLRPVPLEPLADEPTVRAALETGVDLVWFSGDKLLGGPQGGILVGSKDAVARVRKHPMFRALRPGKLELAALEATLQVYRSRPDGIPELPIFQALARSVDELKSAARPLIDALTRIDGVKASIRDTVGFLGSGSAPAREFAGVGVAFSHSVHSADAIAQALRAGHRRVYARIEADAVVLELRSVFPDEREPLAAAVAAALQKLPGASS